MRILLEGRDPLLEGIATRRLCQGWSVATRRRKRPAVRGDCDPSGSAIVPTFFNLEGRDPLLEGIATIACRPAGRLSLREGRDPLLEGIATQYGASFRGVNAEKEETRC